MGRSDFDREPLAVSPDSDYIPAVPDVPSEYRSRVENGKIVPGPSVSWMDDNSPDAEVKDVATYLREKSDARKRGTTTDWNPEIGEILLLAFYNNFTVETLKQTLAEARERYGKDAVKQMAIGLAVEEARGRRFELHRWQFEKVESRCNSRYWIYVKSLDSKPKPKRAVVDIKPEAKTPKAALKPKMTAQQYADKMAELEKLRARIVEIEHQQMV